jgi:hypothetical protein
MNTAESDKRISCQAVHARDSSLRLKNGCAQNDADEQGRVKLLLSRTVDALLFTAGKR